MENGQHYSNDDIIYYKKAIMWSVKVLAEVMEKKLPDFKNLTNRITTCANYTNSLFALKAKLAKI